MEQSETRGSSAPKQKPGLLARFARGRGGVAAIEFAMVAVPFLGLLAAIFETAFVFFVQESFENTVNDVARQVLVNSFSGDTTQTATAFKTNTFCPALPAVITCSKVALNVQAFDPSSTSFSAIGSGVTTSWHNNPSGNVNLGSPGWIVVFQAFYPMPVYLSVLEATSADTFDNLFGHTSKSVYRDPNNAALFVHAIFSTVVFRNEP
ncbi:pilus assembly protein [Rhodoblastus acidophilus]|uniref:Pilus assembly protein n=1 Tax=Candidatus Rhodoblastus alkanivorans TaxID=2954117 RepID=A0ABS9ZAH8_9HYPH|nr:TadE/TadG family type IV pilus assembly protein [Candidatus Rhodoblastus alkanivorans]MCI4677798.1 pilus assembly protein [Candidatus Rhodoblastus alkanivorans]MCI4684704.1 pilus assembly protein [Candidatus Rhodoblastus alkanivorans]MDI4642026.1 pilus assembly protein [Rhodoblastus acidophilus]